MIMGILSIIFLFFLLIARIPYLQTSGLVVIEEKWNENTNYYISIRHLCSSISNDYCSDRLEIRLKGEIEYVKKENNVTIIEKSNTDSEIFELVEIGKRYSISYSNKNLARNLELLELIEHNLY